MVQLSFEHAQPRLIAASWVPKLEKIQGIQKGGDGWVPPRAQLVILHVYGEVGEQDEALTGITSLQCSVPVAGNFPVLFRLTLCGVALVQASLSVRLH